MSSALQPIKGNKVQVPEARQILGNVRNVKKTEFITGPRSGISMVF